MRSDLLTGKLVRLTARDPEKDSATVAAWDMDSNYTRLLEGDPVTPPSLKVWRERFEGAPNPLFIPFAVRPACLPSRWVERNPTAQPAGR